MYAELGTTWRTLMADPDQAAHLLGKLIAALGPGNVLWGTDSIWYGSPQDQIDAFRTFEITAEAQERFGYAPLTSEVKAGILAGNAARLYGVDPAAVPCSTTAADRAARRADPPYPDRLLGPKTAEGGPPGLRRRPPLVLDPDVCAQIVACATSPHRRGSPLDGRCSRPLMKLAGR